MLRILISRWTALSVWLCLSLSNSLLAHDLDERLAVHRQQHAELHGQSKAELTDLAEVAAESGFLELAKEIEDLISAPAKEQFAFLEMPDTVQPAIPLDRPPAERSLRQRFRRSRERHASELYLLARRALRTGHVGFTYDLIRELLRFDPDHRGARRMVGYVRFGQEWITPFAREMRGRRAVWSDRFGWLPQAHLSRYESGERLFRGRWITAAQEAELRRDFDHAWEVRTDHFLVKTNHSLEQGVKVATALENFYRVFFQTFAAFFNSPEQAQKLFEGGLSRYSDAPIRPYLVHYYRDRDEYNRRLIQKIPQIEITNGLYYTTDRTSYFFHDDEAEIWPTLYHEATHQLFYESTGRERRVAEKAHFWIIEGIACYMESFRQDGDQFTLGDPRYIRFHAARYRLLVDQFYRPFAEFQSMGMDEFQTGRNISKRYSQASGLSHFFMHADEGRYREALVKHLSDLYEGDARRTTRSLPQLTGLTAAQIDERYADYIRQQQAEIRGE